MPITISGDSPNLTSAAIASPVFSGTPTGVGVLTSGTAVASTSGTSIDFTSIPSWVKRITVMFNGVSLSSTGNYLVQLGDSGGVEATGYVSTSATTAATPVVGSNTTGYLVRQASAAAIANGQMVITNVSGNIWISSHSVTVNTTASSAGGGSKTLSDVLTTIRIACDGADTFDAGSINILYE
jgi:hypothetical protein